jgi:hypothetical protein
MRAATPKSTFPRNYVENNPKNDFNNDIAVAGVQDESPAGARDLGQPDDTIGTAAAETWIRGSIRLVARRATTAVTGDLKSVDFEHADAAPPTTANASATRKRRRRHRRNRAASRMASTEPRRS